MSISFKLFLIFRSFFASMSFKTKFISTQDRPVELSFPEIISSIELRDNSLSNGSSAVKSIRFRITFSDELRFYFPSFREFWLIAQQNTFSI